MNKFFKEDYKRFCSKEYHLVPCVIRMIRNHDLRVLFWFRMYQHSGFYLKKCITLILRHYKRKYGIELPYNQIYTGGGLRLLHPWGITINANAQLGSNVTLYKGCTIGEIVGGG